MISARPATGSEPDVRCQMCQAVNTSDRGVKGRVTDLESGIWFRVGVVGADWSQTGTFAILPVRCGRGVCEDRHFKTRTRAAVSTRMGL